jgi:hypothetical protein
MFGGVDFPWMLWFVDLGIPESSLSKQESSFNFRQIQTQKLRHLDKVQFLLISAVQSSNSRKCKKNLVPLSIMFSVNKELINNY